MPASTVTLVRRRPPGRSRHTGSNPLATGTPADGITLKDGEGQGERTPSRSARVAPIPVRAKAVQIWEFCAYESVGDRWPASWWSARSVPGGRCRPLCRRSGDTVLISREHPAQTVRGVAGLVRPWRCAGPRSPGARANGPCLRPLAGAIVGNGGTAVRVTACGLAWREQDMTGKRSKSCGGWPLGWPRDHCPRQDTFCRHRKRRRRR